MIRLIAAASALLAVSSAIVSADVVVAWKGTTTQGAASQPAAFTETIRNTAHREDYGESRERGSSAYSIIRDLAAAREFLLWHGFKQYRETTLTTSADRAKSQRDIRARPLPEQKVMPRNETRTIAGLTCHGYDVTAEAVKGRVLLKGTYWVAPKGNGVAEYQRFHQKLRDFTAREGAAVKPGRDELQGVREARELFLRLAVDAGFPCLVDYEILGMNRKWRYTKEAVTLSTSRVPRDAMALPPTYKRVRVGSR